MGGRLALLALVTLTGCGDRPAQAAGVALKPDVIVLCIDGVGPRILNPGPDVPGTAVRGIAGESVVYRNAMAPSPWAGDALHGLLSSLAADTEAPGRAATAGSAAPGSSGAATPPGPGRPASFAEILRADGYSTVLVAAEDEHLLSYAPKGRIEDAIVPGFDELHRLGARSAGAMASAVAATALGGLVPTDAPVLLVCTFGDPRPPHRVVPEFAGRHAGDPAMAAASTLDHGELLRRAPSFSDADIAVLRRIHATEVAAVDAAVARIVEAAEARRAVPPMVVIAGLRRPAFGEDGRFGLVPSLEPEALRVPLLVRFPASHGDAAQPRGVAAVLATHADIGPTILDALGFVPRRDVDGRSLFPGAPFPRRPLLAACARGIRGTLLIDGDRATMVSYDSKGASSTTFELAEDPGGRGCWVRRGQAEDAGGQR